MRRIFLFVTILALFAICGAAGAETGQKAAAEIRSSIEKSAFSQAAKELLLKKAYDAANAGIPPDDVAIVIDRGLRQGADSRTMEGFLDTAVKVRKQNLPVRPVLDRIQQGLSKGVPPGRILDVTERLAEKLNRAGTLTGNLTQSGVKADNDREKENAIQTVARALERSIPENAITQAGLRVKKHNYPLSIFGGAVDMMTNLVESGVSVERAARLVNKALDKGYSEKDMSRMEREIAGELREGRRMEDAVKRMESVMERGSFGQGYKGMDSGQMRPGGAGMGGPGGAGMGGPGGAGMGGPGGAGMGGPGGAGGGPGGAGGGPGGAGGGPGMGGRR